MPKVSIYLPDELYRRAREHGLKLSALAQEAVARELDDEPNRQWIAAVTSRPRRGAADIDTAQLLDDVREDFGA